MKPIKKKICLICRKRFLPNSGIAKYCDTCRPIFRRKYHTEYSRIWKKENLDHVRKRDAKDQKNSRLRNPELTKQKNKLNNIRYKKQKLCINKLNFAIQMGRVARPKVCSKCLEEGSIEGHHENYDKPFDVIWLCKICHCGLHKCKKSGKR